MQRTLSTQSLDDDSDMFSESFGGEGPGAHTTMYPGDEISESFNDDNDSVATSFHSSTNGKSTTSSSSKSTSLEDQLTKKQSQAVLRLRLLVLLLLMSFAMIVSISIFAVAFSDNAKVFESQYNQAAQQLIHAFSTQMLNDVGSISALVVTASDANKKEWPFQVIPNFVSQARRARHGTGILSVGVAPLVSSEQYDDWDDFVMADENTYWVDEGLAYQEEKGINNFEDPYNVAKSTIDSQRKIDRMHYLNQTGHAIVEEKDTSPFYLPIFQSDPILQTGLLNNNMLQTHQRNASSYLPPEVALVVLEEHHALLGDFLTAPPGTVQDTSDDDTNPNTVMFATLQSMAQEEEVEYLGDPNVRFYIPVFDSAPSSVHHHPSETSSSRNAVAVLMVMVNWRYYFTNKLDDNINGITVVLSNTCHDNDNDKKNGSSYTYEIYGSEARVVGFGDHHDELLQEYRKTGTLTTTTTNHEDSIITLDDGTVSGINLLQECQYQLDVYPTQPFLEGYKTSTPIVITMCTVIAFICIIFLFLFYDRMVETRQQHVLGKATQSAALVSSLFPKAIGERLMQTATAAGELGNQVTKGFGGKTMKSNLSGDHDFGNPNAAAPIADLYMNCTVCFMDIAGFTAWSSTREPAQVFVLLQSIYGAFDALAKRRRVFKVETIGDSYMAVTGLPDPMKQHAVAMVRFAADCLIKMKQVVKDLEGSLGPDTGDLSMRVGLNSGPVTAGVLQGQRARYQLFGDTVNTAARMESNGVAGKIQVSSSTAELLRKEGKGHWVKPREEGPVNAKGKGMLQTFWAYPSMRTGSTNSDTSTGHHSGLGEATVHDVPESKLVNDRLVKWMVAMLQDDIKKIVQSRDSMKKQPRDSVLKKVKDSKSNLVYHSPNGSNPIDEVRESIEMPEFDPRASTRRNLTSDAEIPTNILDDLTRFVEAVASRYRNNAFHNFDHACHVTMSVKKLLSRIVAPDNSTPEAQYEMTYGIKSDPLASLAMTFSALIHDVDHNGVSNTQLGLEQPELEEKYRGKSIAEQNSVDIAWEILMEDEYESLRLYIFRTQKEMVRFRQLVVNIVLATDIFDRQLNDLRKARWTKAFSAAITSTHSNPNITAVAKPNDTSLKATIVFEHLIQASDVSHTMQHWHIYRKWNKKLFMEMSAAYKAGRMAKDPSEFWYRGELGFFDNYVIPLAKKMKECGVFGVSSDEYLSYAMQNRAEWEARGQDILEQLKQEAMTV